MDMPSPIPPKPLRAWWESSFMLRNIAPKIREIAAPTALRGETV
jgi:hypothetical protein